MYSFRDSRESFLNSHSLDARLSPSGRGRWPADIVRRKGWNLRAPVALMLRSVLREDGYSLRYFFHVTNGTITLQDEVGQDLFSLDAVKAQAEVVATELAQDDGYEGWAVR